jgi:hypothetical protein
VDGCDHAIVRPGSNGTLALSLASAIVPELICEAANVRASLPPLACDDAWLVGVRALVNAVVTVELSRASDSVPSTSAEADVVAIPPPEVPTST